jgi:UDP-3-O-[3-hydroxymyristoyl] N-acetylglucosamine deacetylase
MFVGNQRTIINEVSCSGKTLCKKYSISKIKFLPAEANTGIVFRRTDLKKNNEIKAIYNNIKRDDRVGVTLVNEAGVEVFNVEHIISAVWGNNIDNIIIEVNCPELPIVDGSTEPLLFLLKSSGFRELDEVRKILEINKEITVEHKGKKIAIKPSRSFIINMEMSLKGGGKLNENFSFDYSTLPYKDTISRARSFYLEYNKRNIDKKDYRHSEEFARHEILDCIGVLYLAGYFMLAEVDCLNGDYELYCDLIEKIFESEENYKIR